MPYLLDCFCPTVYVKHDLVVSFFGFFLLRPFNFAAEASYFSEQGGESGRRWWDEPTPQSVLTTSNSTGAARVKAPQMQEIVYLTPDFAVTGELAAEDFTTAAGLGFKAILNNRPDGEDQSQLSSAAEAELSWQAGLRYRFLPLDKHELFTDPVVEGMIDALDELDGPILAHCKSGLRCAIVWAAAKARSIPVDDVLVALEKAGQDLAFLRDELDAQADHQFWAPEANVGPAEGNNGEDKKELAA